MEAKKILMIDPWCKKTFDSYITGLCSGLSNDSRIMLRLIANRYSRKYTEESFECFRLFFPISENMKPSSLRSTLRGIEYVFAYILIMINSLIHRYDVIHIQWLLMYSVDVLFLRILKKLCGKMVLTAHNVTPHETKSKDVRNLRIIYGLFDRIILHGKNISEEFNSLFSEYKNKVYIQYHGTYVTQTVSYEEGKVDAQIRDKVAMRNGIKLLFCGNIFYNKGTDRLARIWLDSYDNQPDKTLIIVGRCSDDYSEMKQLHERILKSKSIVYYDQYINDDTFAYVMSKSSIVVLPYRHASMSGVVFSAAEFEKPVLATRVGSIPEYLDPSLDSILCEEDDESLSKAIGNVLMEYSDDQLSTMGKNLNVNIKRKYSWENISSKLINDVYFDESTDCVISK